MGNKSNNNLENLEWCDNSKNQTHRARELKTGRIATFKVINDLTGEERIFSNIVQGSEELNINYSTLRQLIYRGYNKRLKLHFIIL